MIRIVGLIIVLIGCIGTYLLIDLDGPYDFILGLLTGFVLTYGIMVLIKGRLNNFKE